MTVRVLMEVQEEEALFQCQRCQQSFWARLSLVHHGLDGRRLPLPAKVWIADHGERCPANQIKVARLRLTLKLD